VVYAAGNNAEVLCNYLRRRLATKIMQRVGCWHPHDPHRDEVCCRMFLERYGFEVPNEGVLESYNHQARETWLESL